MAEIKLTAAPILGTDTTIGGIHVRERRDLALVSVATPLGGADAVEQALRAGWDLAVPGPVAFTEAGDMRAIRTTPDQLMLVFPHDAPDARAVVEARLDGAGYTTDQTDVWVVLDLSGPQVRAALERLCPLDVAGFTPGMAARTAMEHMGAWIVCLEPDRFWLMSASSSARSFLHAVETSCHNVA